MGRKNSYILRFYKNHRRITTLIMMKLLLAISMIAMAMNSVDSAALILDGFTKVSGWTFYKIKVKGTMTNFNVHKACEGNNLSTPCYAGTYDTFNSDECEALKDIFVYKNNWVGDSACGAIAGKEGGYCA